MLLTIGVLQRRLAVVLLICTVAACASPPGGRDPGIRSAATLRDAPSSTEAAGQHDGEPDGSGGRPGDDGSEATQTGPPVTPGSSVGAGSTASPVSGRPAASPDPAQARQLRRRAAETLAEPSRAVRDGTEDYLGAVADIDGNGELDVALLLIDDAFADLADAKVLAQSDRLYRSDARTPELWLGVFSERGGRIVERHRFPIGYRRVVAGVRVEPLRLDRVAPEAFVVAVNTRDGTEHYWFAFAKGEIPSSTVEYNDGSTRTVVTDIENNGFRDFLRYQSVFEQGIGADTLITWIRWTPNGFETVETTNIVRNLTRFLDWARRSLVRGALAEFADHGLLPDTRRALIAAGYNPERMVDMAFLPEPPGDTPANGDDPPAQLTRLILDHQVEQIIFPQIARSPFPDIGRETSFRTVVRVVTNEPPDRYFEVEIGMMGNPFLPQQFFFQTIND